MGCERLKSNLKQYALFTCSSHERCSENAIRFWRIPNLYLGSTALRSLQVHINSHLFKETITVCFHNSNASYSYHPVRIHTPVELYPPTSLSQLSSYTLQAGRDIRRLDNAEPNHTPLYVQYIYHQTTYPPPSLLISPSHHHPPT